MMPYSLYFYPAGKVREPLVEADNLEELVRKIEEKGWPKPNMEKLLDWIKVMVPELIDKVNDMDFLLDQNSNLIKWLDKSSFKYNMNSFSIEISNGKNGSKNRG